MFSAVALSILFCVILQDLCDLSWITRPLKTATFLSQGNKTGLKSPS